MATVYDEFREAAQELLLELGRPLRVARYTRQNNITLGSVEETLETEQFLQGVTLSASLPAGSATPKSFDLELPEDTPVGKSKRYLILSVDGAIFAPSDGDLVDFDGKTWRVYGFTPINIDGTDVLYTAGAVEL